MAIHVGLRVQQHLQAVRLGRGLQAEDDFGIERIVEILTNSSSKQLQTLDSEELKELRESLKIKDSEIHFILKGRAIAKSRHSLFEE